MNKMRMGKRAIARAALVIIARAAVADLQNVEVGGSIEIYGAYYSNFFADRSRTVWPTFFLQGRAIGPYGTVTYTDHDGGGNNAGFVEQRTKLHLDADFTDHVRAHFALDSVWNWGEDFRSEYRTGADTRATSRAGGPEVFEAYVEMEEVGGLPLRLRLGRQALAFGDEWLVGTNSDPDPFIEVTFDAVRATYSRGAVTLDLWAAQLAERGSTEEDGDTRFYGLYAVYAPSRAFNLDAYYLLVRDAAGISDTNFAVPLEWIEDAVGLDNYDPTMLHTAGIRIAGAMHQWDYSAEAAYQWGEADAVGALFKPYALYGDDGARFDTWAGVFEVGYTFDTRFNPRLYVAGAYFGADDARDVDFIEWLNPFDRPRASIAFNRLFSSYRPTHFLDYSALSNFWQLRAGVGVTVTERLNVGLDVMYHEIVEPFDVPTYVDIGEFRVPVAPALPFWTKEGARDLGVEVMLAPQYRFTEDVTVGMQFACYFLGDALKDGVFYDENGLRFIGGSGDEDAASVTFLATVRF